ncbi:hypothetical protein H8N03_22355 [Ramlibacter sp. USB13]|uniref:TolC family protein n=1 Tax=Ramlibacter cellulosilyticus TaxID=2764187 RepID=A0A923MV21_9BURK|nr:hypothetical protein [Ramlibacter cellulosilyticus]MBC5785700.1 hypothetical protein [Ramlibacter cellulosilyticus]
MKQGSGPTAVARAAFALACAAALAAHAQQRPAPATPQAQAQAPQAAPPVRLRLAGSLCNSMTSQALTSQLVPPLSSTASPGNSVNGAMLERMEQQRDGYFGRLDTLVPFNGLYAVGQADQSFATDYGSRYTYGLEWELYKDGRFESKRQLERLRLEGKTQYLQLLRDTSQRQVQEQLLAVEQMRNRLLAVLYEREANAVRPVLERRRQELAAGRATRADVAEMEFKAERAQLRMRHYAGSRDVLVYPQAQELINRIEDVQLQPNPELADRAFERSPDAQLLAVQGERAGILPRREDDLSVRLYLERSKDFDRGPYNAAGVRVRIPLDGDRGLQQAAQASRDLYAEQRESVRAALSQKLALLSERLRLKQNDMRLLQAENRMVRQKLELACYRMDHPVASLPVDADRDVEELTLRLWELQREILTARLDVLEVLTEISAIVKPREPGELYSLSSQPR